MHKARILKVVVVLALVAGASAALAQGIPTGSVSGRVENEGQGLPGVSVTAKSPNLQGVRTTVTSVNGDYYLANLPAGLYTIRMEISGFSPHEETVRVGASQKVTVDAVMSLKAVEASATVIARSEQVSTSAADAATYTSETMNKLPVARTLVSAVALAPGVNQNGPNGAITISGASSFENVMTVNGASIQDNIRGTPFNLFVEDAIQETTTVSSGISAEYGRFTGGVVNTVTKSGGNNFSGSFRATLNNDTWRELTPYPGDAYTSGTVPTYEATLGGPFWKDHVWFFGAFRSQSTSITRNTAPPTSLSFPGGGLEDRYEGKLTITPVPNQTLTGSYMKINQTQTGYYFLPLPILDMASVHDRSVPQDLWVANYNGVLTESLFLEGQYSQRHFTFENDGSQYTDLVQGTVLSSASPFGFYNSPIFCAACPGSAEKRDNTEYFGKLNYFLSTKSLGSHNMVLGFDNYTGSRQSNNYQSGSGYFINGNSVIYQNNDLYPVFDSGTYLGFYPILNAAQPSSVRTQSAFFNDTWKLNDNFSFNLGVRFDKNNASDSRGVTTSDDSKWSPRLAAIWDPTGKGTLRVMGSYAVYVGAPAETQVGAGSNFGSPASFYYYYEGPPINTDPGGPLLTRQQAIQAVFSWFGISAPGQFPTSTIAPYKARVPGVNTVITPNGLVSPSTNEWTVGVGGTLGRTFTYRVDGVYRNFSDFYGLQIDTSTGQVTETQYTGKTFDLGYVVNVNDPLTKKYYGLHTNFSWRPLDSLNIGGSWTWSHLYGNTINENTGSGPIRDLVLQYPEYQNPAWSQPVGNLPQDQRHRLRVFGTWDTPLPKSLGQLSIGFLESIDTGLGYGAGVSATSAVASAPYVTNPGYVQPPPSVPYYYTARDAFRTPTVYRTDFSINYSYNVGPVQLFVQPQLLNAFNSQAIFTNDPNLLGQSVENAVSRPGNYATFNPFTTIPVQGPRDTGANWNTSSTFGQALSSTAYQLPLTFRVSMGVRF